MLGLRKTYRSRAIFFSGLRFLFFLHLNIKFVHLWLAARGRGGVASVRVSHKATLVS